MNEIIPREAGSACLRRQALGGKDERGIIIVLTLIIMAILLSTAIGFADIILSDFRQVKSTDDSILAYYAADAGLEKSLFLLRKADDIDSISSLSSVLGNSDIILDNNSKWNISNSTDYEKPFFRQRLYSGQSVKIYLLNRDNTQAKSIDIEWYKSVAVNMNLSFTQLTPQLDLDSDNSLVYFTDFNKLIQSDSDQGVLCYQFVNKKLNGEPLPTISDYLVEIKPLGAPGDYIDTLKVRAFSDLNCNDEAEVSGISNFTLRSLGKYGRANQEIVAQMPPRDPASGLLGFVLFAEQDITKDN